MGRQEGTIVGVMKIIILTLKSPIEPLWPYLFKKSCGTLTGKHRYQDGKRKDERGDRQHGKNVQQFNGFL
jgi:hypothetical protein